MVYAFLFMVRSIYLTLVLTSVAFHKIESETFLKLEKGQVTELFGEKETFCWWSV